MKNRKDTEYKIECIRMTQADEQCLQEIIDNFLKKMGMVESDFQKTMLHHMSDVSKMHKLQTLRTEIDEGKYENPNGVQPILDKLNAAYMKTQTDCVKPRNNMLNMDKKETLAIHRIMFNIVIQHQKDLQGIPQEQLNQEIQAMQPVLQDKLYFSTGIESDELD